MMPATISIQDIHKKLENIATWLEKDNTHNARCEADALLPALANNRYTQTSVQQIVEATRLTWIYSNDTKRQRIEAPAKLPACLDRHWQVLRVCNPVENDRVFQRAQARALRALTARPKGILQATHVRINSEIFSCLNTQDLCSVSACNRELNYQLQKENPRIWQRLGTSYALPNDYWPGNDFSKNMCVKNFSSIDWANEALKEYTEVGHPLVRDLAKCSGREATKLRSAIQDPQVRFTTHTLPIVKTLIKGNHFSPLLQPFRTKQIENPRSLINLFWTCGYPKNVSTLGQIADELAFYNAQDMTEDAVFTLEWATKRTQWGVENIDLNTRVFSTLLCRLNSPTYGDVRLSPSQQERVVTLLLEILQTGVVLSSAVLERPSSNYMPPKLAKPIISAIKNKAEIQRHLFGCLYAWFEAQFNPQEILEAIHAFKTRDSWFEEGFLGRWPSAEPTWFYRAAKSQCVPLVRELSEMGVATDYQCNTALGDFSVNSLDLALRDKAPAEVIALLRQYGAQPSPKTRDLVVAYTKNPVEQQKLKDLLFK